MLGLTLLGVNGNVYGPYCTPVDRSVVAGVAIVPWVVVPFGMTESAATMISSLVLAPRSFGVATESRRETSLIEIGFATAELAQPRSAPAESTRRRDAIRSRSIGIIRNSTDISDLAGFLLGVKSPDSPASGLQCDVMIVFMVSAASAANMAGTACVIFMGNFSFEA